MSDTTTRQIRRMPDALSFTDRETQHITTVSLRHCLYITETEDTITFHFSNGEELTIPHQMYFSPGDRLIRYFANH